MHNFSPPVLAFILTFFLGGGEEGEIANFPTRFPWSQHPYSHGRSHEKNSPATLSSSYRHEVNQDHREPIVPASPWFSSGLQCCLTTQPTTQKRGFGSMRTSRYKTKMCNKILFDYVGHSKENRLWGTIPRWRGEGWIRRELIGLFHLSILCAIIQQVSVNGKLKFNINCRSFFQTETFKSLKEINA